MNHLMRCLIADFKYYLNKWFFCIAVQNEIICNCTLFKFIAPHCTSVSIDYKFAIKVEMSLTLWFKLKKKNTLLYVVVLLAILKQVISSSTVIYKNKYFDRSPGGTHACINTMPWGKVISIGLELGVVISGNPTVISKILLSSCFEVKMKRLMQE